MFITSVITRLSASTPDEVLALFSSLGSSPAVSKFKVALCQRIIIDAAISDDPGQTSMRPKPQARVQPRIARVAHPQECQEKELGKSTTPNLPSVANGHVLPPSAEILRLMEVNPQTFVWSSTANLSLRIKFELLASYGMLQVQAAVSDKDPDWADLLHDGRLADTLEIVFGREESGQIYTESLQSVLHLWQ
jgi:hypothetical protein